MAGASLAASPAAAGADLIGPIAQWFRDPCTTMTLQWIEPDPGAGEPAAAVEGAWAEGPAGFGFGDADDATELRMLNRYQRVYVRRGFQRPDSLPEDARLILAIRYDDAFIAYLNGREVLRVGIRAGSGRRASRIEEHEAREVESFDLGPADALLRAGPNLLAIEGHNEMLSSSDFSLDPTVLLAIPAEGGDGGRSVDLIPRGARWQYLAGIDPDEGWAAELPDLEPSAAPIGGPDRAAPAPRRGLEFRLADLPSPPSARPPRSPAPWRSIPLETRRFADTAHWIHAADLTGLEPGTEYQFRLVGDDPPSGGEEPARHLRFRTAPATLESPLRFVAGGDMFHQRDLLDRMNRQAAAADPLFALLGGDLAYANGRDADRWLEWTESWAANTPTGDGRIIPMVVAIGNHEVDGSNQPQPPAKAKFFYSLFRFPHGLSNYAVDFGGFMSLILLDSDHTQAVADQSAWLGETLAARAHVPHLFACYHRPAYGTPVKINHFTIRTEWVPLFERHAVDVVFENDHHVYKRTHPLRDGKPDEQNGTLFIGDGAWGVDVRRIPQLSLEQLNYIAHSASVNHLLRVEIDGRSIALEAVDAQGRVFDRVARPARP